MLEELSVEDVYIKIDNYPVVAPDAPVGHVIYMMHHVLHDKHKYRSILVIDDDDHVVGHLTLQNLINAVGPDYLKQHKADVKGNQPFTTEGLDQDLSALSLLWQDGLTLRLQDELTKPAVEHVTPFVAEVALADPIAKCLYLMMSHDVMVLPVAAEEQVIGVVRLVDLFELIAENVEQAWLPHRE